MKKIPVLIFLLLTLTGCKANTPDTPLDTELSLPSEEVLLSEAPTPSAQTGSEPEAVHFPDFLTGFLFGSVSTWGEESVTYSFTPEQIEQLKLLLNMESWTTATDIPAMELDADYTLYGLPGNSLIIVPWTEDQCLILAKSGSDSNTGYLYFAPLTVYSNYDGYIRRKILSVYPNAFTEFRYEYARVNRTHADDGDYYLDHYIYLFDDDQAATLSHLLTSAERTSVADEAMVGDTLYYQFYDSHGGMVSISSYLEQHCLINYFPADGGAFRSFAPLSLIDQITDFMDSLTPLGVVNNTAEYYFDLFRQDRGLVPLVAMSTPNQSTFYDDQLSAYAVCALGDSYDMENGNTIEEYNAVTLRHFGRRIADFDNSMTTYVGDTGRVTATGWSFNSGLFPVLVDESVDENGVVTALFQCYSLSDSVWDGDVIEERKLRHIKEYLLTGNDEGFPEPTMLKVVFEVRFDIPTQTSYLFYHSLMLQTDYAPAEFPLPEDMPKQLTYSSGAGAWDTTIYLHRDGTFSGIYQDSDLGVTGDGYPNGTVYISVFTGTFADIKAIDASTYSLTLDSLILNTTPGEEWIEDGRLYIASEPHGLSEGAEFILCTGDSPQAALFEPYLYLLSDPNNTCPNPYWGLFNEETGAGFFGR